MNISVFGLGYVGGVTAGCLASRGHSIVGVDVHPQKVSSLNAGMPPVVEPGLEQVLRAAKARGLLKATSSAEEAVLETDVSLVCVGTPSRVNGSLDLTFVWHVVQEIADVLRRKQTTHALVLRSTMLPGSTAQLVRDLLGDLAARRAVEVFYYPEFLREGTALDDFENPALAVVGTCDGHKPPTDLAESVFGNTVVAVEWATAEMVKYACNAFHATKIAFANEMGRLGKELGLDARALMELFCQDTKLNLSRYYLKPGNPFGGSCLPKDLRALIHHARIHGLSLPMLESLLASNERHMQNLLGRINESGQSEICILGLSFKTNTDDLRESPMVEIAQALLGRGHKVRIYDPALNLGSILGANRRAIDTRMPHLASLLHAEVANALGDRGLVIAAQRCVPLEALRQCVTPEHQVLDVNGWPELRQLPCKYEGFCW
jgi:GDP-mannose 6-dehydrogenase